jgi:hypothetical protein
MHRNVGRVSYATQSMAETMTKAKNKNKKLLMSPETVIVLTSVPNVFPKTGLILLLKRFS